MKKIFLVFLLFIVSLSIVPAIAEGEDEDKNVELRDRVIEDKQDKNIKDKKDKKSKKEKTNHTNLRPDQKDDEVVLDLDEKKN